ncbi:MAG TPA: hypothetical protein VFQ87_03245 [Bradyrhizobium sp.]|jgi:hypothetical protein|nr:hypothetical protein [Bradyrhizobium sp.]
MVNKIKPSKEEAIKVLRAEAVRLGVRIAGDPLDAAFPTTRCTQAERKRADERAAAAGLSLAEFIRRQVTAE